MAVKLTKKRLAEALLASRGILAAAAKALGVSRSAVYRAIERYGLEDFLKEIRETLLDEAESKLFDGVQRGEPWAITLVLRTLGRSRGYGTKEEDPGPREVAVYVTYERPALPEG